MTLSKQYQKDGFLRYLWTRFFHPLSSMPQSKAWMLYARGNTIPDIHLKTPDGNPGDDPKALCKIEMPQFASHAIMDLVSHPALGQLAAEVTGAKMVQVWWVQLALQTRGRTHRSTRYQHRMASRPLLLANMGRRQRTLHSVGPPSGTSHPMQDQCALSPDPTAGGFWTSTSAFNNRTSTHCAAAYQYPNRPPGAKFPCSCPPGALSLHDCFTLHGSGPNRSDGPRRSFAIHMRTEKIAPRQR